MRNQQSGLGKIVKGTSMGVVSGILATFLSFLIKVMGLYYAKQTI